MVVIENKTSPTIIINVNGRVLELKNIPQEAFSLLRIGEDVFELIDANALRKLSMYSSKIELIKTKLEKYPYALARVRGKGNGKHIKIVLLDEMAIKSNQIESVEGALAMYASQMKAKSNICSNALKVIEDIFTKIREERKMLVGASLELNASKEVFLKIDEPSLCLLLSLTISSLAEIGNNNLEISVDENGIIKLSATTKETLYVNDIDGILKKYPHLIAKVVLIEDICENEAIEIKTMATIHNAIIEYKIPVGSHGERYVKNDYIQDNDIIKWALELASLL